MSSKNTIVLYHAGCLDGIAAAMACRLRRPEAELVACHHGDPAPDVAGRNVLVVDFAFPREETKRMIETAASFLLLDHHATNAEDLKGLPGCVFDMKRSGAMLAWDWAFQGEESQWWVKYVQDRDLWKHELPDTHEVNAYFSSLPLELDAWIEGVLNSTLRYAKSAGIHLVRDRKKRIAAAVTQAAQFTLFGYTVPAVNLSDDTIVSEVLCELCKGEAFAVAWSERMLPRRHVLLQFRSDGMAGSLDVGSLAKQHGGGGHAKAAGAQLWGERVTWALGS